MNNLATYQLSEKNLQLARELSNKYNVREEKVIDIFRYLGVAFHITDNVNLLAVFTFLAIHIPSLFAIGQFVFFPVIAIGEVVEALSKTILFIQDAKKNGLEKSKLFSIIFDDTVALAILVGAIIAIPVVGLAAPAVITAALGADALVEGAIGFVHVVKAIMMKDPLEREMHFKKALKHGYKFTVAGLSAAGLLISVLVSNGLATAIIGGSLGGAAAIAMILEGVNALIQLCKYHEEQKALQAAAHPFESDKYYEKKGQTVYSKNAELYKALMAPKEEVKGTTVYAKRPVKITPKASAPVAYYSTANHLQRQSQFAVHREKQRLERKGQVAYPTFRKGR